VARERGEELTMDPNTALLDIIFAACDGDIEEFRLAVYELTQWLDSGGALPELHLIKQGVS
jgi:hypothetical protein